MRKWTKNLESYADTGGLYFIYQTLIEKIDEGTFSFVL